MFDSSIPVDDLGLNSVRSKGIIGILADGQHTAYEDGDQVGDDHYRGPVKRFFVLERPWRSSFEFLAKLAKGSAQQTRNLRLGKGFSVKPVGIKYQGKTRVNRNWKVDDAAREAYENSYNEFVTKCGLQDEIAQGQEFIIAKAKQLKQDLKEEYFEKNKLLKQLLSNLDMDKAMKLADRSGRPVVSDDSSPS